MSADTLVRDTEATALARRLARAQCPPEAIVSSLVVRLDMAEAEAEAIVDGLRPLLAHETIDAQCDVLDRLWAIGEGGAAKGQGALVLLAQQYCGWGKEGVDEQTRKATVDATKTTYQKPRMVG